MKNLFLTRPVSRRLVPALAAVALVVGSSACSKYLDVAPLASPPQAALFTTANDAALASTATYGKLREWNLTAFNWLALTTLTSDDAEKGSVSGDAAFLDNFTYFRVTPTDGPLDGFWTGQYQEILLCNQVIVNVPNITMDASLKARYVAEAQFLRALSYFNLVRAFGDVPLYLKPPVTPDELNIARSPKDMVYAQILTDLTAASSVLPASYPASDVGRATKGAALSLLSKVKLYEKNWADALAASDQVISLGYSLAPDYYKMFRAGGENGPESIFEIQATAVTGNCDASNSQWAQVQGVRNQFGWGFFNPTASLEAAFEQGDKRKMATILYPGETTPDGDVITTTAPNPRYNAKAYVPNSVPYVCNYGDSQNLRVLRLAEVLLINAEAANELGQTAKAVTDINLVRARAGLAPVDGGISQSDLRTAIWHERRVELALEYGDRYFDLVRQGQAATVLASKGFVAGKNEVMPIPLTEITLSGGKLTQNPGY